PEICLDDWHHGHFEFTKVATDTGAGQTLFLRSGIQKAEDKPGSDSRLERPSARITIPQPEVQAQSSTWWHVTPDSNSVITHVNYRVVRGQLLNLPILIPPDWSVERVESTPPEIIRTWTMSPQEEGHSTLSIELRRPMDPQQTVQIGIGMGPREK